MGTGASSLDAMHTSASVSGVFARMFCDTIPANTTAALTVTGGFGHWQRFPNPFTMPSVGAGLAGIYAVQLKPSSEDLTGWLAGLEYDLGTYSPSTATGLAAMPTNKQLGKPYNDVVAAVATSRVFVIVTVVHVSGTPAFTVTYTDQDGNTGATAVITLPSGAAVNSAFDLTPYLASGDTGIREVTGIARTAGSMTSGTIKVMGVLPLVMTDMPATFVQAAPPILAVPILPWLIEPGDRIAFYRQSDIVSTGDMDAILVGVPETT